MKIRKNDTVTVIAGNDKGRSGKVLKVFPKLLKELISGKGIQSLLKELHKVVFRKKKLQFILLTL